MKLALIGVVAFLLSLGASATVFVLTRPDPETQAPASAETPLAQPQDHNETQPRVDTTQVDQGEVGVEPEEHSADSSSAAVAESHSEASPAGDADTSEPLIGVSTPAVSRQPSGNGAVADDSAAAAAREESARQLARVFSAMRADDAAAVLKHMSNDEVISVLRLLNSRQAGAVLSALDDARAAELSRKLLNGRVEI